MGLRDRPMRPTIVLMAIVCWSTPCTLAAAQTQCVSFSDTIDGVNKDRAVEKWLKSLDEQIEKWKADKGVTGPVTVAAEKPQPHPFWRSSVPSHALLPPDVVSDTAYTICWTGVVSPVVCTSSPGCVGEVFQGLGERYARVRHQLFASGFFFSQEANRRNFSLAACYLSSPAP